MTQQAATAPIGPGGELRLTLVDHGIRPGILLVRSLRGDLDAARELAEVLGVPEVEFQALAQRELEGLIRQAVSALGGDEDRALQILAIVNQRTLTATEKAREILTRDWQWLNRTAEQWGNLLRIDAGSFRQTKFWREELPVIREKSRLVQKGRHRRRSGDERASRKVDAVEDARLQWENLFRDMEERA